jgi:hypothetical protein
LRLGLLVLVIDARVLYRAFDDIARRECEHERCEGVKAYRGL